MKQRHLKEECLIEYYRERFGVKGVTNKRTKTKPQEYLIHVKRQYDLRKRFKKYD